MRLIDIEDVALLKTVTDGGLSAKALWRRINNQPTVDAVPVIRCKDCKHMGDVYLVSQPWLEQKEHRCRYWEHPTTPDDYCNRAERKEE